MSILELLVLLLIAGLCGVAAEMVVGFSPGGFLASVVVGLVGAYLGSWLAGRLGFPPVLSTAAIVPQTEGANVIATSFQFDIVWSIVGAILLLFALSALRRRGGGGGYGRRSRRYRD